MHRATSRLPLHASSLSQHETDSPRLLHASKNTADAVFNALVCLIETRYVKHFVTIF